MHIVIIEDEPLVQQRLVRLTRKILSENNLRISCFDNLDDGEYFLSENTVDLLLLDLNLQGCSGYDLLQNRNGFDLLQNSLAAAYHTIIISAYGERAVKAFDLGVLDFIEKPFTEERLAKALLRRTESLQRSHYGSRYLSIKKQGCIDLVAMDEITHVQAEGHYSLLHMCSEIRWRNVKPAATHLFSKNLEKISHSLPDNFCRIHRSFIVNMNYGHRFIVSEGARYELEMLCKKRLPVGRTRYQDILHILEDKYT